METTLDELLTCALELGLDVTLDLHEEYGYVIKIDGLDIVEWGEKEGLPSEMFEYPIESWKLSDISENLIGKYDL